MSQKSLCSLHEIISWRSAFKQAGKWFLNVHWEHIQIYTLKEARVIQSHNRLKRHPWQGLFRSKWCKAVLRKVKLFQVFYWLNSHGTLLLRQTMVRKSIISCVCVCVFNVIENMAVIMKRNSRSFTIFMKFNDSSIFMLSKEWLWLWAQWVLPHCKKYNFNLIPIQTWVNWILFTKQRKYYFFLTRI